LPAGWRIAITSGVKVFRLRRYVSLQIAFDVQMAEREIGKERKNIAPVIGHAA
jgi:hypothetical protein